MDCFMLTRPLYISSSLLGESGMEAKSISSELIPSSGDSVSGSGGFGEKLVKELPCVHRSEDFLFDIMREPVLLILGARG